MAKPKTAPYLAIKTDVRKDDRFEVLGQIAGYNKYEALGRMSHLWAWCRDRKLEDAPANSDGYVVADGVVGRFLGEHGVKAILAAGVDELALGSRAGDGMIYLRGTSETVGALRQRLAAASAGGIARSAAPRINGRYPNSSRDGAETVPTGWKSPADTVPNSSLPPTSDLRPPTSQTPAIAAAIRKGMADAAWDRLNNLRTELAQKNGWKDVRLLHPFDPGVRELDARLVESGSSAEADLEHVMRVIETEARAKNTVEYLCGSAFEARNWRKKLALRVADAERPSRAAAKPNPTVGRVEPSRPDDYPDGEVPL